jgi:phospholipid/cholesterol/gamma-HCH transport system substrate-binding protein
MATATNHWKLGLFVVAGVVLSLVTLGFLGAQSMRKQVVHYTTFFDESVQGLEVGSPVKFRGVTIGTVSSIDVAKDGRHVSVTSAMNVSEISHLGLSRGHGKAARIMVPPDVRMQLASQGITGVKFMQMDFFDVKSNPPPELPFDTPPNYIPAAVSTLKNLEDAVVRAVNRLPEVAEGIVKVTVQISRLLDDLEKQGLSQKAGTVLLRMNEVLGTLQTEVKKVDAGKLSSQAQEALANLNITIKKANVSLERLGGETGLIVAATGAASSVGAGARDVGREFQETLRDIREVTIAIQRVAEALERDPDMFLKGRAPGKAK